MRDVFKNWWLVNFIMMAAISNVSIIKAQDAGSGFTSLNVLAVLLNVLITLSVIYLNLNKVWTEKALSELRRSEETSIEKMSEVLIMMDGLLNGLRGISEKMYQARCTAEVEETRNGNMRPFGGWVRSIRHEAMIALIWTSIKLDNPNYLGNIKPETVLDILKSDWGQERLTDDTTPRWWVAWYRRIVLEKTAEQGGST